jgi:hypothetical protein
VERWHLLPKADWYFARSFFIAFTLCLTGAGALVTIADLFQRLSDFSRLAEEDRIQGLGLLLFMLRLRLMT